MPKSKNQSRRARSASPTGLALLVCFVIAVLSVAHALRQLTLERAHRLAEETQQMMPVIGQYQTTLNPNTPKQKKLTLTLSTNRQATLLVNYQQNSDQSELVGEWSGDSRGTIIVSFGDQVYAFSFTPTNSGSLKLLNPDVELWEAATLTLIRQ